MEDARDRQLKMRQALEEARQDFEQAVELHRELSKLLKARFDALVDAGFSNEQALELVKARGLT